MNLRAGKNVSRAIFLVSAISIAAAGQKPSATAPKASAPGFTCLNKIGPQDWLAIVEDVRSTAPPQAERLESDVDFRQRQIDAMRQTLALECQAIKDGILNDSANVRELGYIRSETIAISYDRFKNPATDREPMTDITDTQIERLFQNKENLARFEQFAIDRTIAMPTAGQSGDSLADKDLRSERSRFAKINILEREYNSLSATLPEAFTRSTELKVGLQQAQFLARVYGRTLADKNPVTEKEVTAYIAARSDLEPTVKRARAMPLLERARNGEDFAKLADSVSEDPGNISTAGAKLGGLITDIAKGKLSLAIEQAALSLQPGQIFPSLIETDRGFYILKLEKISGIGADLKYDIRQILISTLYSDPDDPTANKIPVRDYVRDKLGMEKGAAIIAKILFENPVTIEDRQPPSVRPRRILSESIVQ